MSEPFLAEIKIVGFDFAPRGWALCDGQILPISQNQSLYSLLGPTYGGDGRSTFALPDLRGRVPIHTGQTVSGSDHPLGEQSGEEAHALSEAEMPTHGHMTQASSQPATQVSPAGGVFGATEGAGTPESQLYASTPTNPATFASGTLANTGGGQPHENMQPFLTLNMVIALQGLFPSRG